MNEIPPSELDRLRGRAAGFVVAPGEAGWDAARQAFNLALDQRPALAAFPTSVDDVAAAVEFARANGLRVAAQRTGHGAAALESLEGTLLLRTERLIGVEVDPAARRARVGAGALWGDVMAATSPHGLAALWGSSPTVGVAGYTLGGGLSFLGRKLGFAANSVTAIELVTADGRVVRTDADNEPELFWALRGGGGSFGIVTAIEFELHATPELYAGALLFPIDRAPEVLHLWRGLTATMPDELMTVGRFLRVPDIEGPPPPLRGRAFALVEAILLGDEATGAELLRPLRDLGPELDTLAIVEPAALGQIHMDPPEPVPARTEHLLTGELAPEAIDELIGAAGAQSDSALISVELRQLGGALARSEPGDGAISGIDAAFSMFAVGGLMDPALEPKIADDLARVRAAVEPHGAGSYFNFTDEVVGADAFFDAGTCARLAAVKAAWDPDGMFQAAHEVGITA
jgi:hypothetical protein